MADEIKKDTVDYRDPTPFDDTKLNSISEISKGIRHKYYGKDTREALAQQGEALVKLIQETGGNQSAEVVAARGNHELLQMREDAQDEAITKAQTTADNKFGRAEGEAYLKNITTIPETFKDLASLKAAYPDGKNGVMVTANDGHKYVWDGTSWADAGMYQAASQPDTTKYEIRTKFNQFNANLAHGKRLVGQNADGTLNVVNFDNSAYTVVRVQDLKSDILAVQFDQAFIDGQFIVLTDENKNVMYMKGCQALVDAANNTNDPSRVYYSFKKDVALINIKQLIASLTATPTRVYLGFPANADSNGISIYNVQGVDEQTMSPWTATPAKSLCYATQYATRSAQTDTDRKPLYTDSPSYFVKKFKIKRTGTLSVPITAVPADATGSIPFSQAIYVLDADGKSIASGYYGSKTGILASDANGRWSVSNNTLTIDFSKLAQINAAELVLILPAIIQSQYYENYNGVFDAQELIPALRSRPSLTADNFNLPPYLPITSGEDQYIYFDNLLIGRNYYSENINALGLGKQDDKIVMNKTNDIDRVITYDDYQVIVPCKIVPNKISGTYKLLAIGESTTAADDYMDNLKTYLDETGATFELLGTHKSEAGNAHEAYGGWGAGTLRYVQSANGLTNAFWNPATKLFDYDYYLNQNADQTVPNLVLINFGINDTNRYADGKNTSQSSNIQFIIDQIKAKNANAIFVVGLTHMPSRWSNFEGQSTHDKIATLVKQTIADFRDREDENIYLNPMYVSLDPRWDMQYEVIKSNRNSDHMTLVGTDQHHPSAAGYANNAYSTVNAIKYALLN